MSKGAAAKQEKRESDDGLVNNNFYNTRKRCASTNKAEVCTFEMRGEFDSIKELRQLCRQYDCQLVEYKQAYDNIQHKAVSNGQCTIRSSQTPEKVGGEWRIIGRT